MTMDEVISFFQICHSTDQPLQELHQQEIAAKKNVRKLIEREMLPTRNVLLLIGTLLWAPAMKNLKSMAEQKISVTSANRMVTT